MKLEGIHHVTCITGDAPRNVDFYVRLLGLRLVKKSVNQDDPTVYHLFYADEHGSAGSDLTFFEYPNARVGRAGGASPTSRACSTSCGSSTCRTRRWPRGRPRCRPSTPCSGSTRCTRASL